MFVLVGSQLAETSLLEGALYRVFLAGCIHESLNVRLTRQNRLMRDGDGHEAKQCCGGEGAPLDSVRGRMTRKRRAMDTQAPQ